MAVKPKSPEEILKRIHEGSDTIPPQPHLSFDPSSYVNTQTKITFIDSEYGEFQAKPTDILQGKKKHPKRLKIQRGLTAQEVQAEVIRIHPYMRMDESTFNGLTRKALFIDEKFGEYWAVPQFVIKHHKSKHPKRDAFIRALPAAEVQRRIREGYQKYPPRAFMRLIEDTYESVDKKALFVDDEHGEWWAFPNNIMKGQCHPKRNGNPVYTMEDVKAALSNRPEITLDESTFINITTKARFIDRDYGEWWVTPQSLIRNSNRRHKNRFYKKAIIPAEEIQTRVKKIFSHLTLDLSTYKKSQEQALFIDEKYGEWWAKPNSVLNGHGHPARAVTLRKLEDRVSELLGFPRYGSTPKWLLPEKSKIKPDFKLTEDIYLEADGIYWHSELRVEDNSSHLKRRELFEKYGKRLFQFREDEILQKPEIVKSIVWNALGRSVHKFHARKCELSPSFEAKKFFEENHLMGFAPARSISLKHQGEVVAALSYKVIGKEFHVVRFCTRSFTSVVGGFSKLLKEALKRAEFSRGKIVNYVDLRYGTGAHLLEKGFVLESISLGWNWTDGVNTFNRLRCRANMDERKLTQKQHAEELGWYRIFDAGQAKYTKQVI